MNTVELLLVIYPVNMGVQTDMTGASTLWIGAVSIIADGYSQLIPLVFKQMSVLCVLKLCLQFNQGHWKLWVCYA